MLVALISISCCGLSFRCRYRNGSRGSRNASFRLEQALVGKFNSSNSRVEDLSDEEIRSLVPEEESLDILIGGPPCQPFSKSAFWHSAGAKGLADPRAEGLTQYLRVLESTRPQAFLLENVPGIKFSSSDEGIRFLKENLERLNRRSGQNYSFSVAELNAADFECLRPEKGFLLLGAKTVRSLRFPSPTHFSLAASPSGDLFQTEFELSESADVSFRTAWDAIGDLEGDSNPDLAVKGKWAALLPLHPRRRELPISYRSRQG